jgi:hypothetical protein
MWAYTLVPLGTCAVLCRAGQGPGACYAHASSASPRWTALGREMDNGFSEMSRHRIVGKWHG